MLSPSIINEENNENRSFRNTRPRFDRFPYASIFHNLRLIWLNITNIEEINNDNSQNIITQLRSYINNVNIFTDVDKCIDFLMEISNEKIFLVLSDTSNEHILTIAHDLNQVECIYIFCKDKSSDKQYPKQWKKLQGIFTNISSICERIEKTIQEFHEDSISISFLSTNNELDKSNENLNQLNQSFMCTRMLKDILLTIDFDQSHIQDFIRYYQEQFDKNDHQQNFIELLQENYHNYSPIWWYTCSYFIYTMLNRALRTMDINFIIKMGFYIRDLHRYIEQLHFEQFCGY